MILAIILSKYLMVLFIMTEKTSVNLPAAHEQIPERAYNRLHPSCEQVPSVQRVFNEQTNASGLEYPVDFIQNQRAVVHRAQCERMHHQEQPEVTQFDTMVLFKTGKRSVNLN